MVLLIFTYQPIVDFFASSPVASDVTLAGDFLVATSILAVTACFGNFAFTYEKIGAAPYSRVLAHLTTGLLMFLVGLSLQMTYILSAYLVGEFFLFGLSLAVLYIACVLYDFWDLLRF